MKNSTFIYLVAGLMAVSQGLQADDAKKPESRPSREEVRERFQNLSPEEREAKRKEFMEKRGEEMKKMAKELGLNPEELRNLPETERRAKIKEAGEKKLTELEKKKADGTISDSEKEVLQKLEQRKKLMEANPGGFGAGKRPVKPGAEKSDK